MRHSPECEVAKNWFETSQGMSNASTDTTNLLEKELLSQIHDITSRIKKLLDERAALERILIDVRNRTISKSDITRKNSINRILLENEILKLLGKKNHTSTDNLFRALETEFPSLNPNTFRTYLHRLRNKGLIVSARRGLWGLPR